MIRNFAAVALLGLFAATLVFAQPPRGRMGPHGIGPRHQALIDELKLTDTQQAQMQKIRLDLMKKQTPLQSKVQTLRLEIQEQFLADKVDRAAIEKNLKAITDVQQQMKMNMLDHWFQVNAILTPEQQKIWKNAATRWGQRMPDGMRMRGMMHFRGGRDWDDVESDD